MAKLTTILDQIDAGTMLLPEFQRGYVWNRDQVRGLMRSLYRGYPVGALLVWETESTDQAIRGAAAGATGQKSLLLDGQQRVTTLYGIVRGRAPVFFEGDPSVFEELRFNVLTEAFQFHAPVKMKDDPFWIDVTELFVDGTRATYKALAAHPDTAEDFPTYAERIQQLRNVLEKDFHVEAITGADKTVDVVVDIFNRVNSGGTKLSKGDLALARICSEWGEARPTMRRNLDRWAAGGFHFTADWLLRTVNAVATGRAPFSALEDVSSADFEHSLNVTLPAIDHFLSDLAVGRLGLDHDRVLMGRYAVPVLARHLSNRGGRFAHGAEADRALYWYLQAALRGRFAGSTETFLAKDLETVDKSGIDGVIAALARSRKGNLAIDAQDFEGVGRGSRSYPLLYLLARVNGARDLVSGTELGRTSSPVGVHEIFPKTWLSRAGLGRSEVNAIANFAFVTPASGTRLSGRDPAQYLAELDPEVLRSQWIPEDPSLWSIDAFPEFLAARRELLARSANEFLDALHAGTRPWAGRLEQIVVTDEPDETDARAAQVRSLLDELVEMGFARPALDTEIPDPETGRPLAVAEAFWADGLQPGQGAPVVLELDPEEADLPRLAELGCEVFTSVDALRGYVQRRSEVVSGDAEAETTSGAGLRAVDPDAVAEEVDADFDRAVLASIDTCREELRYNPRWFRVMVNQHGAMGATRRLLRAPAVSDGFVKLWQLGRLDLTAEALVADPRFSRLFDDDEVRIARLRLDEYGTGATTS
ncbi:GmrSD restriction endonuclease domain-containing protein [Pseudonocardia alni]|uniref:GmrSD restriction endonuclease domain-containing protein n=1 Tax=Pseudonocardia alni TaxID=33907 RepID=UPI00340C6AAF